jgi:hypothetical protein
MITIERVKNVPEDFLIDNPEGGAFYRAYSRARVPGIELGCFIVKREGDTMVGFHQLICGEKTMTASTSAWTTARVISTSCISR